MIFAKFTCFLSLFTHMHDKGSFFRKNLAERLSVLVILIFRNVAFLYETTITFLALLKLHVLIVAECFCSLKLDLT